MKNEEVGNELPISAQQNSRASDQKFCHACAKTIHISASMCPSCGAQQQPNLVGNTVHGFPNTDVARCNITDQRYCRGCGNVIHATALTCPRCGARQSGDSGSGSVSNGAIKSRVTGAILAFFLGGLGVHKFYCGKIGMGFLYLVLFWTWIPALVALVEGIIFLTNSSTDEEFTRKYCV